MIVSKSLSSGGIPEKIMNHAKQIVSQAVKHIDEEFIYRTAEGKLIEAGSDTLLHGAYDVTDTFVKSPIKKVMNFDNGELTAAIQLIGDKIRNVFIKGFGYFRR